MTNEIQRNSQHSLKNLKQQRHINGMKVCLIHQPTFACSFFFFPLKGGAHTWCMCTHDIGYVIDSEWAKEIYNYDFSYDPLQQMTGEYPPYHHTLKELDHEVCLCTTEISLFLNGQCSYATLCGHVDSTISTTSSTTALLFKRRARMIKRTPSKSNLQTFPYRHKHLSGSLK